MAVPEILDSVVKLLPNYQEIILLELEPETNGPTCFDITSKIRNYTIVPKYTNSGAKELLDLNIQEYDVVGVNTCYCVEETVADLESYGIKCNVLITACSCEDCNGTE